VLAWTAAGRRQTEIAATLGLSERTAENHLRSATERSSPDYQCRLKLPPDKQDKRSVIPIEMHDTDQ
jgi:predicted transcriptional regulator